MAPLSAPDWFMSPIKLFSPHISVTARHQRSEEDPVTAPDPWRRCGGIAAAQSLAAEKGRGGGGGGGGDLLRHCLIELQLVRTIRPCHLHVSRILSAGLIEIYCKG